jgi:uncharacterized membrane protein
VGKGSESAQNSPALDSVQDALLDCIKEKRLVARDINRLVSDRTNFGDWLADRVAAIGGSWGFIIVSAAVLIAWMMLNTDVLSRWGLTFDPYPYVFLNLMLSSLAALQAPIIMMSQNRQSATDRLAAQLDYQVNLRTELEMLGLHEKLEVELVEGLARLERKIDALARLH